MKTITIKDLNFTVLELLKLAENDNLIIQEENGKEFILALVDDFNDEVESLKNNQDFLTFLEERNKAENKLSLKEARNKLGI